ncbi:hypothetical protein CSUI_008414, partial [Cystoisospora suis]
VSFVAFLFITVKSLFLLFASQQFAQPRSPKE